MKAQDDYRIDEIEIDSYKVHIGRDAKSNDYLSLRFARANDYWFHVKGMPSAHVVLACHDNLPEKSTVKKIAAITAYYSKQKNAGKVAIIYTMAKYVSKSRGAKPGSVVVKKETLVMVKPASPESFFL
ncbi:NFACT RNA binding domain-containing protein [Candidatus Uabimicrobium sp. HlEnr_7]|uniref:NFACT RNA binding domain-containing protein n=1 Tax=Candidatus Uabimicrobium helgolandensis TaxID=3095367 RepID=UPI0035575017